MTKKQEEEVRILNQKLDSHTDTSLDRFKQTALVSVAPTGNRGSECPSGLSSDQ